VPKGLVRSSDQDGRRWAKGEVALKFVVKVNVAREKRMLYYKEDRLANCNCNWADCTPGRVVDRYDISGCRLDVGVE
jgi:hypothetical protein